MADQPEKDSAAERDARRAAALRANLHRRKAQSRARAADEPALAGKEGQNHADPLKKDDPEEC